MRSFRGDSGCHDDSGDGSFEGLRVESTIHGEAVAIGAVALVECEDTGKNESAKEVAELSEADVARAKSRARCRDSVTKVKPNPAGEKVARFRAE